MKLARVVVVIAALAGAAYLGYWAADIALEPPDDPLAESSEPVTYVVEEGSVGRSLSFTATAEWDLTDVGLNSVAGVVTTVDLTAGHTVQSGSVVYSVNLRPVTVAEGETPMFRTLTSKTVGPDVVQLQILLTDLGFYEGEADGSFGSSTRTAVRDWQESLGLKETGVVEPGDMIFVADLPARLTLDSNLKVGSRLAGGEPLVFLVPDSPNFRISLAPEQAALVPLAADVLITYPGGTWEAQITQAVENTAFGQLDLLLAAPDGSSVCGELCADWIALEGQSVFRANVIVVPDTLGPVVPVGAITTDAGNAAWVTLTDESTIPVEILATASGLAVVDGIAPGTEILLPIDGP